MGRDCSTDRGDAGEDDGSHTHLGDGLLQGGHVTRPVAQQRRVRQSAGRVRHLALSRRVIQPGHGHGVGAIQDLGHGLGLVCFVCDGL